jgi:hypothetical protein
MFLSCTPDPRFKIVLEFPALLKVAVSPAPGTGVALQFVPVAHTPSVVPFQVALTAKAVGIEPAISSKRAVQPARKRLCLIASFDECARRAMGIWLIFVSRWGEGGDFLGLKIKFHTQVILSMDFYWKKTACQKQYSCQVMQRVKIAKPEHFTAHRRAWP